MTAPAHAPLASMPADACVRCGYDLRGVGDDQPCPECGLLAERSRRPSEHLTDTLPGWLRGIWLGVTLVLAALCVTFAWTFGQDAVQEYAQPTFQATFGPGGMAYPFRTAPSLEFFGYPFDFEVVRLAVYDVAALLLIVGVWLLTRRERTRPPGAELVLRFTLRLACFTPLTTLALLHARERLASRLSVADDFVLYLAVGMLTVGCAPLPALLFAYLRRLAIRVLHPGLAEHAAIVGVGLSATLLLCAATIAAFSVMERHRLNPWMARSNVPVVLILTCAVGLLLFGGWSALNCVRFAIAFRRAHRGAQRKWALADRSAGTGNDEG